MPISFSKLGQYGRLGNSLLQAGATISFALNHNDNYLFPNSWEYKDKFNISSDHFVDHISFQHTYEEPHFHYASIPYRQNLDLHGYYQSWRFIESYQQKIKQLLTPKAIVYKQDKVSIHVRRTDYLVHTGCYQILDRNNYYDKAMELFPNSKFLIFSDDIAWCKQQFTGNDFEFSEGNAPEIDLKLMANCTDNIIANSSLSLFAAFINQNENRKVVAPDKWFGPKLSSTHNTKDLYLPGTIRI